MTVWPVPSFAQKLVTLMDDQEVGVNELARRLEIDASAIRRWRRGDNGVSVANIQKIARALGVPYTLLVPDEDEMAAATAPAEGEDWTAAAFERRQTPRRADGVPPSEQGTASG